MKEQEFSPFQRYFNSITFYLFTLSVKYKNLEDYDEDGPFESHYKKFFKIKTKLNQKIIDDDRLLINQSPFNEYYEALSNIDLTSNDNIKELKKLNKNFRYKKSKICDLYLNLSDTLPKSKIRSYSNTLIACSVLFFVLSILIFTMCIVKNVNSINFLFPSTVLIISLVLFYLGLLRKIALKQKNNSILKFNYYYSSDYCFRRIKESEKFFFDVYKIDNDYYEISELEIKFPEIGNLFERTIIDSKLSDSNKEKLLIQNKNLYVRVFFSEFFELLKNEGIEELQQISFMFAATLKRANISIQGNTGFAECVNTILKKTRVTDVSFNQAKAKYSNEEDLFDKYRDILKKYENILQ